MNIAETLKKDYPKAWEKFRNYLRENYEFWEKQTSDKTLWFCDRSFQIQIGHYLDYFEKIDLHNMDIPDEFKITRNDDDAMDNVMKELKEMVLKAFAFLESKEV